jgi:hypothetical protein
MSNLYKIKEWDVINNTSMLWIKIPDKNPSIICYNELTKTLFLSHSDGIFAWIGPNEWLYKKYMWIWRAMWSSQDMGMYYLKNNNPITTYSILKKELLKPRLASNYWSPRIVTCNSKDELIVENLFTQERKIIDYDVKNNGCTSISVFGDWIVAIKNRYPLLDNAVDFLFFNNQGKDVIPILEKYRDILWKKWDIKITSINSDNLLEFQITKKWITENYFISTDIINKTADSPVFFKWWISTNNIKTLFWWNIFVWTSDKLWDLTSWIYNKTWEKIYPKSGDKWLRILSKNDNGSEIIILDENDLKVKSITINNLGEITEICNDIVLNVEKHTNNKNKYSSYGWIVSYPNLDCINWWLIWFESIYNDFKMIVTYKKLLNLKWEVLNISELNNFSDIEFSPMHIEWLWWFYSDKNKIFWLLNSQWKILLKAEFKTESSDMQKIFLYRFGREWIITILNPNNLDVFFLSPNDIISDVEEVNNTFLKLDWKFYLKNTFDWTGWLNKEVTPISNELVEIDWKRYMTKLIKSKKINKL